jgi:heme-degrading monooxygenase HmoA
MEDFVAQLDEINLLAEQSEGFIWRLKSDDGNATSYNPYNDDTLIINFSIWENTESLKNFVYKSLHAVVMRDRKKWFDNFEQPYYVLWKIKPQEIPSIDEAALRLKHLQVNGSSEYAFDFKNTFL